MLLFTKWDRFSRNAGDAIYIKFIFEEITKGVHNLKQVWLMALEKDFECSKNNVWALIRNPVYCGK